MCFVCFLASQVFEEPELNPRRDREFTSRTHQRKYPQPTKRKHIKTLGQRTAQRPNDSQAVTNMRLPDIVPIPEPRSTKDATFSKYHLMVNHIKLRSIQQMAIQELIPLPPVLKQTPPRISCSGCAHGRRRTKTHKRTELRYEIAVALSSDVCGPIAPKSWH